jgi:hypothetical protein
MQATAIMIPALIAGVISSISKSSERFDMGSPERQDRGSLGLLGGPRYYQAYSDL